MSDLFAMLDEFNARLEAQRVAEKRRALEKKAAAEAARRAPRVTTRYLTVGQAHVTVTEMGPRDDDGRLFSTVSTCRGCTESYTAIWHTETHFYTGDLIRHTVTEAAEMAGRRSRAWAQAHAETCRALPMEG